MFNALTNLFIQEKENIRSWWQLKNRLLEEFGSKLSNAQIEQSLARRKIWEEESVHNYFLIMKESASQGRIEDDLLIQYTIDGITDD